MQAFEAVFAQFGIGWLTPIVGIMLVTASLGGMLTWLAGPSKGLLLISRQEGYLPPFLQRLNKNGVQQNILVTQGVVTTFIALGYALIPSVSSAYWIFSVITTQVYLIMYLLMFVAAVRLRRSQPDHPRGYRAPILVSLCGVGFTASLAALLVGFIPPSQFSEGNSGVYILIVAGGALGPRAARPVPVLPIAQAVVEAAGRAAAHGGGEPVMTTDLETQSDQERRSLYIGLAVVVAVMMVVGLLMFKAGSTTQAAEDKAAQLITEIENTGAHGAVERGPRQAARGRRRRGLRRPQRRTQQGHPAVPDDHRDRRTWDNGRSSRPAGWSRVSCSSSRSTAPRSWPTSRTSSTTSSSTTTWQGS